MFKGSYSDTEIRGLQFLSFASRFFVYGWVGYFLERTACPSSLLPPPFTGSMLKCTRGLYNLLVGVDSHLPLASHMPLSHLAFLEAGRQRR